MDGCTYKDHRIRQWLFGGFCLSIGRAAFAFLLIFLEEATMPSKKTVKVVRDAKTGEFVKKGEATRRPSTTVTETIKKK